MSFARWLIIATLVYLAHMASNEKQIVDAAIFTAAAFIVLTIDSAVEGPKEKK